MDHNNTDLKSITGQQRAAIIMLSMNQLNSSKIMSALNEDEVKALSHAMSNLGHIDNIIIDDVISEFKNEIQTKLTLIGNVETTEKFLQSVLGKEKATLILDDIKGPIGKSTWDKLANVNEDLLAAYLKNEHPQTIALIISKLSPNNSAKILSLLPEELTHDIIMRMLNLDLVKKETLERVEQILRSDFINSISKEHKRDSHELMAEIFNNFDRNTESKYMGLLEERSPDHAKRVKELMFTFDDLIKLRSQDLIILLRDTEKAKLTIALKGANETIRKLFMDNMSQRAKKILIEDIESLGPVRLKDVDNAQATILANLKSLIEKGEISLSNSTEEEFVE
jgi:flagellar motor switch protein FliG